jgi:hypothetical protein
MKEDVQRVFRYKNQRSFTWTFFFSGARGREAGDGGSEELWVFVYIAVVWSTLQVKRNSSQVLNVKVFLHLQVHKSGYYFNVTYPQDYRIAYIYL